METDFRSLAHQLRFGWKEFLGRQIPLAEMGMTINAVASALEAEDSRCAFCGHLKEEHPLGLTMPGTCDYVDDQGDHCDCNGYVDPADEPEEIDSSLLKEDMRNRALEEAG